MNFDDNDYFSDWEFESPDLKGSGIKMDPDFIAKLTRARHTADITFNINSGFRTKEHNVLVGGKSDSSHLKGLAADIRCFYSQHRFIIINALMKEGFHRIGVGKNFIHVDDDHSKTSVVMWLY